MFTSKTFNLVNEEEARKRDRLYEPKRCRWMKYIFIPALIGFILLLILTNVDFSPDDDDSALATITTKDATKDSTMTSSSATNSTMVDEDATSPSDMQTTSEDHELSSSAASRALWCVEGSSDRCEINCSGGNLNNVNKELAKQQKSCDSKLRVIFESSWFPSGRLSAGMLDGDFEAETLQILSSDLTEIDPWAFEYASMASLTTLVLNPVQLVLLSAKSFVGLSSLEVFELINSESYTNFYGVEFLQPMALTLQQVTLRQLSSGNVYNPAPWLQGASFPALWRLDLSGNNFGGNLNQQTFGGLVAIRELVLANSAITSLAAGTFATVADTLELLDLRLNQLTTLGEDFWADFGLKHLRLELHSNAWNCTCDNHQLIAALKTERITCDEQPLCASPQEWVDGLVRDVTTNCGEASETPTTATTTTTNKPTAEDTTESNSSSSSSNSSSGGETEETGETETETDSPETNQTEPDPTKPDPPEIDPPETEPPGTDPTDPNGSNPDPLDPQPPNDSEATEPENPTIARTLTCATGPGFSSNITIEVRDRDARFTIWPASTTTSLVLVVYDDMENLSMIYFLPKNYTYVDVTQDTTAAQRSLCVDTRSSVTTVIQVEQLQPNLTYTFCLVPDTASTTSPLNCRSHLMQEVVRGADEAWLRTDAIAWFVSVVVLGAVLCLCLGSLAVYWLLSWRPTWLRGSRRLFRVGPTKHEVYLVPKNAEGGPHDGESCNHLDGQTNSLSLSLDPASYDYMQYYKSLHCPRVTVHPCGQRPPSELAPSTPVNPRHSPSLQSTIRAEDLVEENEYQSIDYYEELF